MIRVNYYIVVTATLLFVLSNNQNNLTTNKCMIFIFVLHEQNTTSTASFTYG